MSVILFISHACVCVCWQWKAQATKDVFFSCWTVPSPCLSRWTRASVTSSWPSGYAPLTCYVCWGHLSCSGVCLVTVCSPFTGFM